VQYNFEWDPAKAKQNLRKHKISFERAAQVFLDPYMLSIEDEEHGADEQRWVTLGRDKEGVLLVVIHTFREIGSDSYSIRLIFTRKTTRRESKEYTGR
jgi:uncharacterized protein